MIFKRVAILTSRKSWFVPYAVRFQKKLRRAGYSAEFYTKHEEIPERIEVAFILSYFRIIPKEFLSVRRHNIVVHESALPQGSGWAPLFWQILEGKRRIPFTLFEAAESADAGVIYLSDELVLSGDELHQEIRNAQARKTISMCERFLMDYDRLRPRAQRGRRTYYRKRIDADSELDIGKSIRSQFNLLRIVHNKDFPAYFRHKGRKFIIKIRKEPLTDIPS